MRTLRADRKLRTGFASGLALAALGCATSVAAADGIGHPPEPTAPTAGTSIVGGEAASISELPWLAYIQSANSRSVRGCTGTVVSPRVILTAGHCVQSLETGRTFSPGEYRVVTGVANVREAGPANISQVSQVLVFPQFSSLTLRSDAGVLILSAPTAAPALPMARLPVSRSLGAGTPALIAGWGYTDGRSKRSTTVLQVAETVIHEPGYCLQRSRSFYPYFSAARQFCAIDAPGRQSSACQGDSGGPAIARLPDGSLAVVGITSLGVPNCNPRQPSIFVRVDQVVDWVDEWIAASEGLAPPPPIPVPSRRLPFLSTRTAKGLAFTALGEDFRRRFRAGRAIRIGCGRIEREKVKCGVSWYQGPNDYYGTITVYLTVSENEFVWNARYKIRWVNHRCWFSGNRPSCVIHTKSI